MHDSRLETVLGLQDLLEEHFMKEMRAKILSAVSKSTLSTHMLTTTVCLTSTIHKRRCRGSKHRKSLRLWHMRLGASHTSYSYVLAFLESEIALSLPASRVFL
jgi:hypothetical protein